MIIEAVAMYWPMALCTSLYLLIGKNSFKKQRVLAAAIMSSAWVAAVLPWVNHFCYKQNYWSFHVDHDFSIIGLPLSLYIGWILLWGILPAMLVVLFTKTQPILILIAFLLLDIVTMPLFSPVLVLDESYKWLIGEFILIITCLTPAIYLSRWVIYRSHVGARSTLISIAFILLILANIPVASPLGRFYPIRAWNDLPLVTQCLSAIFIILFSLPGITGVIEFAIIGNGTPIPFDPPRRLVTSGVYMYVRNPMQLSMVFITILWAIIFSSWLMLGVAVIAIIYCVGLAHWSESNDLETRYGVTWQQYSRKAKSWKLTILPTFVSDHNSQIYIDFDCSKCLAIKHWLKTKNTISLEIKNASDWNGEKLTRITYYDPNTDFTASGVIAFARALQHIHLGWALLAWFISLPILSYLIQASLDASGAGPQSRD